MDKRITILYTHNIRGKLDHLPRLATLIQQVKAQTDERVLLLDAGDCCHKAQPLCQQTEGRAAVILLDAIGYDAVNVTEYLSPASYERLEANYLAVELVNGTRSYTAAGIEYGTNPGAEPSWLHIALETDAVIGIHEQTLQLQTLNAEQLGVIRIKQNGTSTEIVEFRVLQLADNVQPVSHISGTLDFIREEAAHYEKQKKRK